MSCQEYLSLLSAYLDGEVQGEDAKSLERHLAECELCARELDALRRTATLLHANAEVEPPPHLLERIEAVTVNRKTLLERLHVGLVGIPRYVQVTAAGAAAAVLLIFLFLAMPQDDRRVGHVEVKPATKQPVVVVAPTLEKPSAPMSSAPLEESRNIARFERKKHREQQVAMVSHRTSAPSGKRDSGVQMASPVTLSSEQAKETEESLAETPEEESEATSPAEPQESTAAAVVAEVPANAQGVQKEPEPALQRLIPQEDPSAIEQLRARLAAKNKQRFEVKEDPIVGKKHSVPLVGFRF